MKSTAKSSHGGLRSGAGRKSKYGEPSTSVRVPASLKPGLQQLLSQPAFQWSNLAPIALAEHLSAFKVPLFGSVVRAGFPSPADDYVADTLDLNEHLMPRREATFLLRAQGESMVGVGIHDGDILVVDRSLNATHGRVVIAAVDGQFTVKTLEKKRGRIRLMPANPEFPPIEIQSEQELQIWGVVTNVIHSLKP